jgi:hypothetical protein
MMEFPRYTDQFPRYTGREELEKFPSVRFKQARQERKPFSPASLKELSQKRRRSSCGNLNFSTKSTERHIDLEDSDDQYPELQRPESRQTRQVILNHTGRQGIDSSFTQSSASMTSQKESHKKRSKKKSDRISSSASEPAKRNPRRRFHANISDDQDSTSRLSPVAPQSTQKVPSSIKKPANLSSYPSDESLCLCLETFLNRLEPIVDNTLRQQLSLALGSFIEAIVGMIEKDGIKAFSHQEFLAAHIKYNETFRYVRRGDRTERQQIALYTYMDSALASDDGLFNKVKRNVLDAMCIHTDIYNGLMGVISPDEVLDEEKFLQYLEEYIDNILNVLLPKINNASFALISDLMAESTCCCCSMLSHKDWMQLASAAGTMLKGVLKKILNEDIVEGAAGLVKMIPKMCGIDFHDEDADGDTGLSIPIFNED